MLRLALFFLLVASIVTAAADERAIFYRDFQGRANVTRCTHPTLPRPYDCPVAFNLEAPPSQWQPHRDYLHDTYRRYPDFYWKADEFGHGLKVLVQLN
jgi:hypothetical protein